MHIRYFMYFGSLNSTFMKPRTKNFYCRTETREGDEDKKNKINMRICYIHSKRSKPIEECTKCNHLQFAPLTLNNFTFS